MARSENQGVPSLESSWAPPGYGNYQYPRAHVYQQYLHLAPKSLNMTYIWLLGA